MLGHGEDKYLAEPHTAALMLCFPVKLWKPEALPALASQASGGASQCEGCEADRLANNWELVGCWGFVLLMTLCCLQPLPQGMLLLCLLSQPRAEQLPPALLAVCQCTSNGKEQLHVALLVAPGFGFSGRVGRSSS